MPIKDLTGRTFGRLSVIEKAGKNKYGNILWRCKCECGNVVVVPSANLIRGNTKSCGCLRINDLTGKRYGKLLVSKRLHTNEHGETWYLCTCDCGNEVKVSQSNLVKGHSYSCGKYGCKKTNRTHGMRFSDLYKKYYDIHTRCGDKDNLLYGGRGIAVCQEWSGENGFVNFMEWSRINGYKEGLSLDRIDVDGDYCPSNCRWVSMEVQAQNKRLLPSNTTGVSGVYPKDGRYAAQISVKNKRIYLGTFKTIQEAKTARKDAEIKYWGWTKIKDQ